MKVLFTFLISVIICTSGYSQADSSLFKKNEIVVGSVNLFNLFSHYNQPATFGYKRHMDKLSIRSRIQYNFQGAKVDILDEEGGTHKANSDLYSQFGIEFHKRLNPVSINVGGDILLGFNFKNMTTDLTTNNHLYYGFSPFFGIEYDLLPWLVFSTEASIHFSRSDGRIDGELSSYSLDFVLMPMGNVIIGIRF